MDRRKFLTGAAAVASYAALRDAEANVGTRRLLTDLGTASGPAFDFKFALGQYSGGSLAGNISVTRAQTVPSFAKDASGNLVSFAADTARITSLGFLKEPAATNIQVQTNNFSTWTATAATAVGSAGTSPEGLVNANSIIESNTASIHKIVRSNTLLTGQYTFSVFGAPLGAGSTRYLFLNETGSTGSRALFDVVAGTVLASSGCTAGIEAYSNGFFRAWITPTSSLSNQTFGALIGLNNTTSLPSNGGTSYTGDGVSGLLIYQSQLELGAAPSSPIKTTGASATRNADVVSISGALATLLASANGSLGIALTNSLAATAGTLISANGSILLGKTVGDTLTDNLVAGLTTANTANWTGATKGFISWAPSGRSLTLNGGAAATDANAMTPSASFYLGSTAGSSAFDFGYTTRLAAWRSAVPASFFSVSYIPASMFFWGDSLTVGNQDGTGVTYPSALSGLYSPARSVVNKGVGGDTSTQILTRFQALSSSWSFPTAIWSGRNDYSTYLTTVLPNIATMVGDLTSPDYVVLSVINGEYPSEAAGQSGYVQITALNAALASTYGSHYVDVRSPLVASYNPANPVDVIDHANDTVPFTKRAVDISGTIVGAILAGDTTFTTSVAVATNYILLVGSEYIYITGVSGTTVTSCTRGYAGTTAAGYGAGQAFAGTDPIHLNAAGYTLVAQTVFAAIRALGGW